MILVPSLYDEKPSAGQLIANDFRHMGVRRRPAGLRASRVWSMRSRARWGVAPRASTINTFWPRRASRRGEG
jgi:hypothetical protein